MLLLLSLVAGLHLPSYSGNLLGVVAIVRPVNNHQALVQLCDGGLGARVDGIATVRPRNNIVLDSALSSTLSSRLIGVESVHYIASGDTLFVRVNLPFVNATLRLLRDDEQVGHTMPNWLDELTRKGSRNGRV